MTYFVGVISGTSVDGLDVALLETGSPPKIVAAETLPFSAQLAEALRELFAPGADEVNRSARADAELGDFIGHAVRKFLDAAGVRASDVRAIGSHGQTIRHEPDGSPPFTVQIGDPNRIAEITGIDCIADFRRRDVAADGEGAPLVPPFHAALFRSTRIDRTALNIGGISNITVLARDAERAISGFDTGPGNALLDAWITHVRNEPFDRDGDWAASGQVHPGLLQTLQTDEFVSAAPPKSTGKERYHLQFIERALPPAIDPADVQATLLEFTAWSVAYACREWGLPAGEVIVCGGGRLNSLLMRQLQQHMPAHDVVPAEQHGVDGDAIEAGLFAWLAAQFLAERAGNEPAVTGAAGPRRLGAFYPGA